MYSQGAGGVTFEIGVDPSNPDVPVIFNKKAGREDEYVTFIDFKAAAPPAASFTVPKQCQ